MMSRRKAFFHVRQPSWRKSLSARTSPKRAIENAFGLKAPRGWGWLTNPRRAAYNRIYNRRTMSVWTLLKMLRGKK
jgi:hypothetical protein